MSKELEALKTIKIKCHSNSNPSPIVDTALEIVEQALIKAQEQEKVLEIVFKKDIDIVSLKHALSVKQYNSFISFKINYMDYMKLTQEEFDLLKRYCNE